MFKSKMRQIIISQSEHARLSGHLAYFWGNAEVALPPIDPISFAMGVTHHDRGYGHLDTMAIGEVDDAVWLATQKRGILTPLADPIADTVALMHIRRLLNYATGDAAANVIALAEQRIEQSISETPYTRDHFNHADTITDLCDMVSFALCFEEPTQFQRSVDSQGETKVIQVTVLGRGHIQLSPYPFSIPEIKGFILGYHTVGYPDHLQPVIVEYTITSNNSISE